MIEPPFPDNEASRIASLKRLNILDSLKDVRFERITKMAQSIFNVPIVLVSLVDSERQWFKSCIGLSVSQVPRSVSFCGHAILANNPFIINDALTDPRFCDNPLVIGPPFIRFYAGIPIHGSTGERIGSFCVIDSKPRQISFEEINTLKGLASWVDLELNLHSSQRLSDRLELAVKGSNVGIWDWIDVNDNEEWWSDDFYSVLGYSKNEILPTLENFKDLLHLNDQKKTFEMLDEHFKQGRPFDLEYRLKTKDQGFRWFHGRGTCVRNENQKPIRMVGTIIDIHERKVFEKSLHDQKFALDQHAIVAVADKNMKIIYANDKFCEISKFSREELIGQDHVIVNSGYHSKEFMKNLRQTISSGKVWKGEIKNKAKDGSYYWVDTTITPFLDDNGVPFQYIAIRRDITQRKNIEEAQRVSELKYRSLFNSIDEGFCILQMIFDKQEHPYDFSYIEVNPAFLKQTGLCDVQGKRVSEVIPSLEDYWFKIFGKVALTGESIRFENWAGGLMRWYDVYAFCHGEKTNRQIAVIFTDITERKKTHEQIIQKTQELDRSNKELEQFAYVASHDLQEPLRMVSSFCGNLERKYKDKLDDTAKEYIHFAVDGAKRMQGLIDALLTYAKQGKKEVPIERVDLNQVVAKVLHDLNIKIKDNNATVKIGQLPVIIANEIHMHQLFQNFISNAIKYRGSQDPIVEIKASKVENLWQLSVSDNGIGIEEEHFSKIFVIFQRLHAREEYPGVGIGLALCKKIVENYNGTTWLSSTVGKGTTFYFTLKVKEG